MNKSLSYIILVEWVFEVESFFMPFQAGHVLQIFNDKKPWNVVQSSRICTTSRANTSNQIGRIVNLLSNHALPTDAPRRIIDKLLAQHHRINIPKYSPSPALYW